MFKACSYCGRIHNTNQICSKKPKKHYKTDTTTHLRSTHAWTLKSKEIRQKAKGLCEYCLHLGQLTYDNIEVHHIVKLRQDESKLLDNNNLIALCQQHHKQADKGQLDNQLLTQIAAKRENQNQ